MKKLDPSNAEADALEVRKDAETRHLAAREGLAEASEEFGDEGADEREEAIDHVVDDNLKWEETLAAQAGGGGGGADVEKLTCQRDYSRDEMRGRIEDLGAIKVICKKYGVRCSRFRRMLCCVALLSIFFAFFLIHNSLSPMKNWPRKLPCFVPKLKIDTTCSKRKWRRI